MDGAFTVLRQSGGYRRYVTETGTHSVKLYVVVDTPVMAQMRIPTVFEILQLQYIDKMVDVCCAGPASSGREETVEIPQLQPVTWTWPFTRPLCATTDAHGRCPHVQFIDISHVPVIMQRRCTGEIPQIQLSPVTVDIPVVQQRRGILMMAAMKGFWRSLRHFSRSSGYPGVERQFFEVSSAHNCECSRAPEQRGDAASAVCGCTGGTNSSRCGWPWQQPFITAVMLG